MVGSCIRECAGNLAAATAVATHGRADSARFSPRATLRRTPRSFAHLLLCSFDFVASVSDCRTLVLLRACRIFSLTHKRSAHGKRTMTSMQTSCQSAGALIAGSRHARVCPSAARRRDCSATTVRAATVAPQLIPLWSAASSAPQERFCFVASFLLFCFVASFLLFPVERARGATQTLESLAVACNAPNSVSLRRVGMRFHTPASLTSQSFRADASCSSETCCRK